MPGVDVVRKIFYTLLFACLAQSSLSDTLTGKIYILGNIDDDKKIIFHQAISNQIHGYAQHISLSSNSHIYVYPYQHNQSWEVVTFHVVGEHHHEHLSQVVLNEEPLKSLDQIRAVIGLDGSLKYVSWNSYAELPLDQIFLASKSIAQEYLFHHF